MDIANRKIISGKLLNSKRAVVVYDGFVQHMVDEGFFYFPERAKPGHYYVGVEIGRKIVSLLVYEEHDDHVEIRGAWTDHSYRRHGLYEGLFYEMADRVRDRFDVIRSGYNRNNTSSAEMQKKRGSVPSYEGDFSSQEVETSFIISQNIPLFEKVAS